MSKHRIVILGNGMVGNRFIEEILKKDCRNKYTITVFCEEKNTAYDRVSLSSYFDGKTKEELINYEFAEGDKDIISLL